MQCCSQLWWHFFPCILKFRSGGIVCVGSVSKSLFEIISRQKFAINGGCSPTAAQVFFWVHFSVFLCFYFSIGICKCCNAICFGLLSLPLLPSLRLFVVRFSFFSLTNKSRRCLSGDFMMRPSASHDSGAEMLKLLLKSCRRDSRPKSICCWLPLTSRRDSEWNVRSHHNSWEHIIRYQRSVSATSWKAYIREHLEVAVFIESIAKEAEPWDPWLSFSLLWLSPLTLMAWPILSRRTAPRPVTWIIHLFAPQDSEARLTAYAPSSTCAPLNCTFAIPIKVSFLFQQIRSLRIL